MCKNKSKKGRIILKFCFKIWAWNKAGHFFKTLIPCSPQKQDGPIYCQAGPFARFMLGPSITHTTFAAINIIQKLLDGITSVAKLLSNSNPFESLGSHFCSLMFFFLTIFTLFYCSQKQFFWFRTLQKSTKWKSNNIVVFVFPKYDKFWSNSLDYFNKHKPVFSDQW